MLEARRSTTGRTPWAVRFRAADPFKVPIDSNGNLTSKTEGTDVWGYEWNARSELTRVTKNSVEQARFAYDPLGRRVEKIAGSLTTTYGYNGANILRELKGSTTLKYVHGSSVDQALAVDDGVALSYLHADGLGSIVKMTGAGGAVTLTRQYDSWGMPEIGTTAPGYAFTGRDWDPETGLYYYRARYYDPKAGRFVSADPIGFRAGPNVYSYVRNQPASSADPFGLRIHVQLSERAAAYDLANTCRGSVGATCYWSGPYKLSPCKKKGSCYGFDVLAPVTIGEQFTVSWQDANTMMSSDSFGLTLQQHEDLHMQDFREGLTDSALNAAIETEGFKTLGECQSARAGCPAQIDAFIRGVADASHSARDKP